VTGAEAIGDGTVEAALRLEKRALGRLVSLFEDPRPVAIPWRREALAAIASHPARRRARFVGITGTPGAGKSTLIGELALRLVSGAPPGQASGQASEMTDRPAVAVLAVDPSSPISGGALLGDRTRVRFPVGEPRLYFRSQASERELGGVSRATYPVCRLLGHLFDLVFVETVGIGQSEVEVKELADTTYLVLQPLGGDQIQFLKAGIMEIPDAIILNKCDEVEAARRTYHALRASLKLARPDAAEVAVFRTSAKSGEGLDALVAALSDSSDVPDATAGRAAAREGHFFRRWVQAEYGRAGLGLLIQLAGEPDAAARYLAAAGGFEAAQIAFAAVTPWSRPG
jgi:LAO/AO transport system ATPase